MFDMREIRGCLAGLASKDEDARRRLPNWLDEDGWQFGLIRPYALDISKIQGSKALRRLRGKTQTLHLPRNSHMRDRLAHSSEVSAVAATVAELLGLNVDLCRAAGLWHDVGHTPLGHMGEAFLARITGKPFRHEVMSVVLAQQVERSGSGLNLCHGTLSAVRNHSRNKGLSIVVTSLEDDVVMLADKIAFTVTDYNDLFCRRSVTGSVLRPENFPEIIREMTALGLNSRARFSACITALCRESAEKGTVSFVESETAQRFRRIKKLMSGAYSQVPDDLTAGNDGALEKVYGALAGLEPAFDPAFLFALLNDEDFDRLAAKSQVTPEDIGRLSVSEVTEKLHGRQVDIFDPDLNW